MNSYDPLIFGKNQQEKIIGLEVVDKEDSSEVQLFIQELDGSVSTKSLPNKYWILSDKQIQRDWVRLKGDLHYKFGKQYNKRTDFQKFRSIFGKNNDIYSIWNPQEAVMVKDGITLFKNMKVSDVSVLAFDIETPGFIQDMNSKILIIANTFKDFNGNITRKMFSYDEYESQAAMLEAWCSWVQETNPTIICGHNILSFDLPYLQTVAELNGVELKLGRDGSSIFFENKESKFRKEGSQFINYKRCKVFGRHLIDTFFLAIKYDAASRKYESYGLKNIIKHEGLEVEDRQHYDASQIAKNYQIPEEWKKIKRYAEFDGDDALKLYELMIPSLFYMTQNIPKTIQGITESATGSQINLLMCRSYLQDMHSVAKQTETYPFKGAISYAIPGMYSNCVRWDLSALYPSIMRQYGIFPEGKDPNKNFIKILEYLTLQRLENKKKAKATKDNYYKYLEQSQKILCNSFYGFLSAPGLNFNYPKGAEFITAKGREILKLGIFWASGKEYLEKDEEIEND